MSFYVTSGTLRHEAPSYVERQADRDLWDGLLNSEFCYVLTSRQMGKSSLMVRTANRLRQRGIHVTALDLTAIGQNLTPEQWYEGLLMGMGRQLRLEDELDDFWRNTQRLSPVQRWFTAISDVVLPMRSGPLVIFVDEIDTVRSLPFFTDEFFAAIRECYNRRAAEPVFNRLTFCLLGVATPSDLMRDSGLTPFNIGRRVELHDFSDQESIPLSLGLRRDGGANGGNADEQAQALLQRILYWTHGHPYLTQRLCRAVAEAVELDARLSSPRRTGQFVDQLCEDHFLSSHARERDDNLLFVRERLLRSPCDLVSLLQLYGQVLGGKPVLDDITNSFVAVLRLSGITKGVDGRIQVRNRIYERVFNFNWLLERLEAQRPLSGKKVVDDALAAAHQLMAGLALEQPTGQQKQVTVLLAAVSGFPTLSEAGAAIDASEIRQIVWKRLAAAIAAHGGTIGTYLDDALNALFGSTVTRENEPEQAIRAALAMQSELKDLQEVNLVGRTHVQIRIGINTGPVVLSSLGRTGPQTKSGNTVSFAHHLLQAAPAGGILISHNTYRHLRSLFEVQPMPPITPEATAEPVEVYLVQRAKPRVFRLEQRGVEGVETRMVGRQAEFNRLQDVLSTTFEEQELQIVTIIGDAGIGKSRLLYEFNNWLAPQRSRLSVFNGRASEGTSGLPYSLLRDVFAFRFEIQDSDRPAVARQKLEQGLSAILRTDRPLTSASAEAASEGAHFIGHLIGLDFSASPHLRGIINDARQIRDRAFRHLTQFFLAASRQAGLLGTVLLLEDLHWADDGSLDWIDHLVRTSQHAPIFILGLTRPMLFERRPAWGEGQTAHTRRTLQPLSRRDSRQLVEEILRKATEIPQVLRELVVSGSEGNPFYLEELIKMLIDVKVIIPGDTHWRIDPGRLPAIHLPPTLTGVLQARLDRLSTRERSVLQRASVMGRIFWDSAVEQVRIGATRTRSLPAQPATLETLEALRRKELIFRREASAFAGITEYIFGHALLRDVIYESVLEADRREYHKQAASWLIEQSGERAAEFAPLVAAHYEAAGNSPKAAAWYGRAGNQARSAWAPATAIGYYEKALSFLGPAPSPGDRTAQENRAEWYSGLGECLAAQARFTEASEVYQAMRAAAETLGNKVTEAQAWNGLAFVQERQGANRASVDCAAHAATLAQQAADSISAKTALARALFLKGWAYYRLGDAEAVLSLGEQGLDLCHQMGVRHEMTNSLKLIAVGHLLQGRHREAERHLQQALTLARAAGDRRNVGAMLSNMGETARLRGDYPAAVGYYQEAIGVAREIGDKDSERLYLSNVAGARVGLGDQRDLEAAEADLKQVLAGEHSQVFLYSETYRFLAETLLGQGRLTEALEAARRAVALGLETENKDHIAAAWRALGLVTMHPECASLIKSMGSTEIAKSQTPEACFSESLKVFTVMGAEAERARTLRAWAKHELASGDRAKAAAMWQEAQAIFRRLEMELESESMRSDAADFSR